MNRNQQRRLRRRLTRLEKSPEGSIPQAKEKPKYFQEEGMINCVKSC